MKFLAAIAGSNETNARKPEDGEPCVPNFGVCGQHMSVGLATDGLVFNAKPATFNDGRIDELFEVYKKRYPSLPEKILEKYLFASAQAAVHFATAKRVKVEHLDNDSVRFYSPEEGTTLEVPLE